MHPARPVAGSVLVAGGRVAALDAPVPDGAAVIDCRGGLLLPGFVDPHVHLLAAAAALRSVDCSPGTARSIADIQRLIAAAADATDGWVRAVGYDESALREARHPTRWDLDEAAPDRPVRLLHRSGHAVVLNSRALAIAGIRIDSEEPPGGVIDRRIEDGEPTGLLIDMDTTVDRYVPPLPFDDLVEGMRLFNQAVIRAGVTAVQDMTHTNDAERLRLLEDVCQAAGFVPHRLPPATRPGMPGAGPVKLMLAEAGGISRAQAKGLNVAVGEAHAAGRQVAVHAVTVAAVDAALDAIEAALEHHPRADHRHRVEHASICPPPLAARAAGLGVVVVSNPAFLHAGGERYRRTVAPEDLPHLYAAGLLAARGVTVAAASDAPVTSAEPLIGIAAAINRRAASGLALPGEGLSPLTALTMTTRNAAYAAFADGEHGIIGPGRRADLVLLDTEPGVSQQPHVWWTLRAGVPAYLAADAPSWPPGAR
jgi:predicted amidohydrolase YtcJ